MKNRIKRFTALILAMAMCLSLLSANVWAAEEPADASVSAQSSEEAAPEEEAPAEESAPTEEEAPAEESEPTEEEPPAEEPAPAEEAVVPEEVESAEESAPIEEEAPAEESAPAEEEETKEPAPGENEPPAEESVPAEEEASLTPQAIVASGKMHYTSGYLAWTLDDEGTLTISGTTGMGDYESYDPPWSTHKGKIVKVIIEDGVTSIGDWAFYNCKSLTSVTIPNSVTRIGSYAFGGCSKLPSITIPDSVTSIGNECAFGGCSSLTSVTIGNSVTSIELGMFDGCSSLTSIDIPNSVTSIDSVAFYECSSLTSVTIGNGVTSIGDGAFASCTSLTSVTIPDSVTSIGYGAFDSCTSLTSVTIPKSVTSIEKLAFGYVYVYEEERDELVPGFTISGYTGSAAQKYATDNNIPFISLDAPAHEHTWDNGTVTTPATCKSEGVKTYTCKVCKQTKTEPIAKLPKVANTITGAAAFTKTANANKDQSFNLGASANGAALSYKSSNKKVTVKNGKVTIKKGFVGTATIKITSAATDTYKATSKKVTVTVNPAATQLSSVKWNAKKKAATAAWKKNTTGKGYEAQYTTDKQFKKNVKKVKIGKNATVKTTIKNLKKGTWYFRIRTVNGKNYSGWSKVKTLKIAK